MLKIDYASADIFCRLLSSQSTSEWRHFMVAFHALRLSPIVSDSESRALVLAQLRQ